MRAVDAIMECLKAEGVDDVFGLPGGANLPTYDALYDAGLRHVLSVTSRAPATPPRATPRPRARSACALARAARRHQPRDRHPDAMMDCVPTVFITGQVRTDLIGTDGFQEADVSGITMPIVKHSIMIQHPREIPRAMHEAFHIARTGRPGPVLVDIPPTSRGRHPVRAGDRASTCPATSRPRTATSSRSASPPRRWRTRAGR